MASRCEREPMRDAADAAAGGGPSGDAEYEAWLDARIADAIDAQDDAEVVARAYGPEPEFMLGAWRGGRGL